MNTCKQIRWALGATSLLLGSLPALADTPADVQDCRSGATNQSQHDCLREAGAVRQQGVQNQPQPSGARLQANAEERCSVLAEADRSSCLLRMQGAGTVSGSVGTGGIYRELTEPVAPPPVQ